MFLSWPRDDSYYFYIFLSYLNRRPSKMDCQFIAVQFAAPKSRSKEMNAWLIRQYLFQILQRHYFIQLFPSCAMSVLEPESLRPSEEKIDPAERLEKAKKLKEDGNAKFKAEEQQMVTDAYKGREGQKIEINTLDLQIVSSKPVVRQLSLEMLSNLMEGRCFCFDSKVIINTQGSSSADNLDWYHCLIDEFVVGLVADIFFWH